MEAKMAGSARMLMAGLAALTVGTAAQAQGWRGGGGSPPAPRAVLYELPGFQGRQISVTAFGDNLARSNFNDIAQSARFEGRWRVCEDAGFRGRCLDLEGEVPDLAQAGMNLKISSLQGYLEDAWSSGGGWRGGWSGREGARPFEGARNVLFPYPTVAGFDIAAGGGAANAFCRSMGLGSSAYHDSGERAPRALDEAGRYVGDTGVLRDVLCRKY
ncbi:MAG TPA: beta/gamma crystallin-related protein [Phenylobacterium sp.]|nr:beta/gamma crystallin-related protein [Phenylobacterium sp.]